MAHRVSALLGVLLSLLPALGAAVARATVSRTWQYVGPFPIGKTELDADPLGAYGGAFGAPNGSTARFPSELAAGGLVGWSTLTADAAGTVTLAPNVDWNPLVQSLQRVEVLEHVGVAMSHVEVTGTRSPSRVRLSCRGVVAFALLAMGADQPTMHAGDIYQTRRVAAYVTLHPGRHALVLRVRAKGPGTFGCEAAALPATSARQPLSVSPPTIVPDVEAASGHPWGLVIGVPVVNTGSAPLGHVQCDAAFVGVERGASRLLEAPPLAPLAPGAATTLACRLPAGAVAPRGACARGGTVAITVTVSARRCGSTAPDGTPAPCTATVPPPPAQHELRCRSLNESAVMTFIDHDGGPQAAAVVPPLPLPPAADNGNVAAAAPLPILLSLHGTGVGASAQADAYKRKPRGAAEGDPYIFGVAGYWLLAPHRHGAHNHAGVGQLHAFAAVDALAAHVAAWRSGDAAMGGVAGAACADWRSDVTCLPPADRHRILFSGHSMGGYGAWLAATAAPDRAIAAAPLAGWLAKEHYADANTFQAFDAGEAAVAPALASALLTAVRDQRADVHAANLVGVPTHIRVGARDATTPPYLSRRMARLLAEAQAGGAPEAGRDHRVAVEEVPGQAHWWWDSLAANDGGVVNDAGMRNFYESQRERLSSTRALELAVSGGSSAEAAPPSTLAPSWRVVCTSGAAVSSGRGGVIVLQQHSPHVSAVVDVDVLHLPRVESVAAGNAATAWRLRTSNVRRLRWTDPRVAVDNADNNDDVSATETDSACAAVRAGHGVPPAANGRVTSAWLPETLCVDGQGFAAAALRGRDLCAAQRAAGWLLCPRSGGGAVAHVVAPDGEATLEGDGFASDFGFEQRERGPHNSGFMRAVASSPFVVVIGTGGGPRATAAYAAAALFISSLHAVAWDAPAPVVNDTDLAAAADDGDDDGKDALRYVLPPGSNLVLLGGPSHNAWTAALYCAPANSGIRGGADVRGAPQRLAAGACARSPSFPLSFERPPAAESGWGGWSIPPWPGSPGAAGRAFSGSGLSVVSTIGWWDGRAAAAAGAPRARLALLVAATDEAGLAGALRLSEPTVPPMVRAPFANLSPDVMVSHAPTLAAAGYAGVVAAGYWTAAWQWAPEASYLAATPMAA